MSDRQMLTCDCGILICEDIALCESPPPAHGHAPTKSLLTYFCDNFLKEIKNLFDQARKIINDLLKLEEHSFVVCINYA